ncbi:DUF6206 family protein [Amycolatopsis sp. FU40]|uniref:DUF6206 family protein n=1 Tax=Amycolatopsis sp. FU40 TaxID=2914159 RepID=UPI001F42C02D|nr:DUF6206 family protein [Amycolatopsis sp. FU40]UKD58658.1 DUF6206 family protein [Amycolatopsis sp. FU40]
MSLAIASRDLDALERQVQAALRSGDYGVFDVLGHGEDTLVLKVRTGEGTFACKRLPPFPDCDRFQRYEETLARYVGQLSAHGITVAPTELRYLSRGRSGGVAYCVQEALPPARLCSKLLHTRDLGWAKSFFARYLTAIGRAARPDLGLDAQASNWFDLDGELVFVDVTTPFLRDGRGREQADVGLLLTSLPWILRGAVKAVMLKAATDKYYSTRGIVLDFLGNLYKDRLDSLVPVFLEQANERLEVPLSSGEVARYYAGDARMWAIVQRLRKADRFWQRTVRRRTYPFLLPPTIRR